MLLITVRTKFIVIASIKTHHNAYDTLERNTSLKQG
jgi:hypothetical protein